MKSNSINYHFLLLLSYFIYNKVRLLNPFLNSYLQNKFRKIILQTSCTDVQFSCTNCYGVIY